jgi:hypothetical protein
VPEFTTSTPQLRPSFLRRRRTPLIVIVMGTVRTMDRLEAPFDARPPHQARA